MKINKFVVNSVMYEVKETLTRLNTMTENPCVGGSIPSRATTKTHNIKTYKNHRKLSKSFYTTTINYNLSLRVFLLLVQLQ